MIQRADTHQRGRVGRNEPGVDSGATADLAERVADTEQQIGGDTRIVISSTAIIVALLLIIIFAVD